MSSTGCKLKRIAKLYGLAQQRIHCTVVLAFGLLFLPPCVGFINFAYDFNFLDHRHVSYFFFFVLIFSYLGFVILRTHADRVRSIGQHMEKTLQGSLQDAGRAERNELNRIAASFEGAVERLEENNKRFEEKAGHLRRLYRFVGNTCTPMEPGVLLNKGLQYACEGVAARRGSILLLDESRRHHFTVVSAVGSGAGSQQQLGAQIPFGESRFRQAVLQRRPAFFPETDPEEQSAQGEENATQDCGAVLVVPLVTGGDVIGAMCLREKAGDDLFCGSDLDYVLPLASCLACGYEKAHLRQATSVQNDHLNCLSLAVRICNQGLMRGKVFQQVMRELRRFMPVSISFLALFDTKQEYLEVSEVESEQPVFLHCGMRLALRHTLFGLVLRENRHIHQDNLTGTLDSEEARWFEELGIHSCYLAPFRIRGVNSGMLFIGSDSERGFTAAQQIILQQVSELLGLALNNHMLQNELEGLGRELETLNQLAGVLTLSGFDLDRVLDQVVILLDRMLTVEAGAIYLREGEGLVARRTFGTSAHQIKPGELPLSGPIGSYVTARGESVLVRDVSQNPHMAFLITDCGLPKVHSILCVPMVSGEEVVGVLHLWNKKHGSFSSQDEKVMRWVAAHLAIAVASCTP